ncbi:conserved hypothetical protein [Verticillium alfalfae VaMs.102]|uniref:Uncharacterized protein n=1 Tax=Verticillium alfalfae (strain VaMs.102 / ATCC MYA-4576 / FGSC 10136) TaxID=526221 RepID=C9SVE8_VERA1|nr:conserved hypothetical protein [Verticillium alfalfae VaMs.102]EEY22763.1 conserved hypothetical protein [Verticillium alfalfae VaMs.102]
MPSSKKDKKNAKDGGGVSSAVSKLAAASKFANASKPPTATPPSSVASPNIGPVAPSSYDGNPTISPPLDALSTTPASVGTAVSANPDWIRGGLAGSPGNLISLMGESPPTQPSSYEDHSRLPYGWANHRQFIPSQPASPSPPNSIPSSVPNSYPNSFRRPLSFQQESHFPVETHAQASAAAYRRASMQSPFSQGRVVPHPPPPHHPQAHFYGAPDLDLDIAPQNGMKPGENGYHFGFDTLPSPSTAALPGSDNVVITGYEGGLEVHSVTKRGVERVAGLRGLRGGVYNAKILPWTASGDHTALYPLIAVVVHGPVLPQGSHEGHSAAQDNNSEDRPEPPGSPRTDSGSKGDLGRLRQPDPLGDQGRRRNIVVASGPPPARYMACTATIEGSYGDGKLHFGCTGKLWTSLQQPTRGEVAEESERRSSPAPVSTHPKPNPHTPIFAVNGRWIAYCPPPPSTQITLRAHVPVPVLGKGPTLSSVTPPGLPAVTSAIDTAMSEGVMNKIMRETTQELISGAKWVGQQGMQAWNAYWNKNTAPQRQPRSPTLAAQQWPGSYPPRSDAVQFPPTHATPGQTPASKDPALVSIVDMGTMGALCVPAPRHCVPDAARLQLPVLLAFRAVLYTKSSPLQVSTTASVVGPRVRQIAHFSRMTVARIVEVTWSRPNGERIAMVTERGTGHLLDMPESAYTWPPPRRRKEAEPNGAPASETSSTAVSIASNAFGARTAINQLRHTGENRVSLPPSTLLPSASCVMWMTGRKYHSLYVVGDGLVRTFPSKTRRASSVADKQRIPKGNRYKDMKLPSLPDGDMAPKVKQFIEGDEALELSDQDMDACNTLTLEPRARTVQVDFSPEASIPQAEIESSAPYQPFHTDRRVALYEYGPAAGDADASALTVMLGDINLEDKATSKQQKKKQQQQQQQRMQVQAAAPAADFSQPWAFGQKLDLIRLDLSHVQLSDEDFNTSDDPRALPLTSMERVMHVGENRDEIVVTTRRRRGARHPEDEDGFFEDDCEVLDFADQRV